MANKKKLININYDVVDNATDEQVEALAVQYSQGDPDALQAVELYLEAAARGDTSARKLIERLNAISHAKNKEFMERIDTGDPKAAKRLNTIIGNYNAGTLTLGEKTFLLEHAYPLETHIDLFINDVIGDPEAADDFLETLTPRKLQKILPSHVVTPQEADALTYTREEKTALRHGTEEEKARAKAARRERAKRFLSSLTIGDFITITKTGAPRRKKKATSEEIPTGTASRVDEYVTTKDLLSKAVFGEPGRGGKTLSLIRKTPGTLTLFTTRKGKNAKEVTIYTRLDPDEKVLKAAGITIEKNLSKCAREVYGALLSHYLAGNNVLSFGMVGKIIFNVRNGNDLTEAQKKYIKDGATEIFSTSLYVNTTRTETDENGFISLLDQSGIRIDRTAQVFPGQITTKAYINGNYVETAIELFRLPTLYELQNLLVKGQILRAPVNILEIPGRTDEDLITIRAYLLRRIDAMKHSNLSRMVIYKNILDEVDIDPTDRAQRNRKSSILKKVERVLDYWKEKGYIHDYKELVKDGKPVKGTASIYEIEIIL